jgi:hypothetical protein
MKYEETPFSKKNAFAALWTVEIDSTDLPSVETSWFLGAFAK